MSSDKRFVLSKVPPGVGWALDLGGGKEELRRPLERRGYRYANVDLIPGGNRCIRGDAHQLPFKSGAFDLVVSSDSLEHLKSPVEAIREVRRVMKPEGAFVIWVPFLHPFHGDDFYRYTPLGLRHILGEGGLEVVTLEAPLRAFSVVAQALIALLQRIGLGSLERGLESAAAWLDRKMFAPAGGNLSFAASYLVVAKPDGHVPA